VFVGGIGLVVHLTIVGFLYGKLHLSFTAAQCFGVLTAMTLNYHLNNVLTFRDRRLVGYRSCLGGWWFC
jgi:dolichol-phosphate mannosyltransferase